MTGASYRKPSNLRCTAGVRNLDEFLWDRLGEGTKAKYGGERAVIPTYEKEHPHPETGSGEDALFELTVIDPV